ncbi:MAG: hypothetical protein IT169_00440 [Bryobacterales bacterium]|nr:hypothetical protein [Bryobacterales bacterium]
MLPFRTVAASREALAATLRQYCLRAFNTTQGGLALARVGGNELLFQSHPRALRETLRKPGSTVKPFLLRRLLEWELLRPEETFPCSGGPLPFAGRRFDCSHAQQGAPLDPTTALALSCNRCFLHWAERLPRAPEGRSGFAETLRRAGFSARQAFGLRCAAAVVGNPSSRDEMLLQALGEAQVLTTPLALLSAYGRLLTSANGVEERAAMRVALQGMHDCVRAGTGVEARVEGLDLGGKTGTSTSADRRSLNGWMLSFWPAAQPRLVMVVFVENGRGGAEAAPIAGGAWRALRPHLQAFMA